MVDGGSPGSSESIKFRIPSIPPSMNGIYHHVRTHGGGWDYVLTPEARFWKTEAKKWVPGWKPIDHPTGLLYFNWTATHDWYYQNGKVKRADITNLEKILIDAVCEKLGVGDQFIWDTRRVKVHSVGESFIDVEMGYITT